ncbi:MAG: NADH-quinone oxidoreductase subunit A [Planctomycetes bacterium]|nr:NADH-quinone oxidoreductase subunit A [Planctomycetota bacterium]
MPPEPFDFNLATYFPILLFMIVVGGFATVSLLLSHLINPGRETPVKQMPYESGMDPIGDAYQQFDVRFYLIAILFLVFDVELLFLYPWAVASFGEYPVVSPSMQTVLFWEGMIFLGTLLLAWIVAWRKGVFRWR